MAEERVVARAAEARGEEEKVVEDWVGEARAEVAKEVEGMVVVVMVEVMAAVKAAVKAAVAMAAVAMAAATAVAATAVAAMEVAARVEVARVVVGSAAAARVVAARVAATEAEALVAGSAAVGGYDRHNLRSRYLRHTQKRGSRGHHRRSGHQLRRQRRYCRIAPLPCAGREASTGLGAAATAWSGSSKLMCARCRDGVDSGCRALDVARERSSARCVHTCTRLHLSKPHDSLRILSRKWSLTPTGLRHTDVLVNELLRERCCEPEPYRWAGLLPTLVPRASAGVAARGCCA
jgi:hypothetical protein